MPTFNVALFESLSSAAARARLIVWLDRLEVYTHDNVDEWKTSWSSVCRTLNALSWGMLFQEARLVEDDLRRLIRDIFPQCPTAAKFEDHATLAQMLSTTIGNVFKYSDGDTWPNNHQLFAEFTGQRMHEYVNQRLLPAMGGRAVASETSDDKTVRLDGSARDLAYFGEIIRREGVAETGEVLVPDWYVRLMRAGGTYGDGSPNAREGYQTHLWKDGTHSESLSYENPDTGEKQSFHSPHVPNDACFAYGGTDRAVVAVVPSLRLVVARHNSNHGYPIDTFLDAACAAVEGVSVPAPDPCVIKNYTYESWLELGRKIDVRFREVSGQDQPPAGTDFNHNTWRVLAEGWTEEEMLAKVGQ
jgi:hypothetical protein